MRTDMIWVILLPEFTPSHTKSNTMPSCFAFQHHPITLPHYHFLWFRYSKKNINNLIVLRLLITSSCSPQIWLKRAIRNKMSLLYIYFGRCAKTLSGACWGAGTFLQNEACSGLPPTVNGYSTCLVFLPNDGTDAIILRIKSAHCWRALVRKQAVLRRWSWRWKKVGKSEKENLTCWGESATGFRPMKWKIGVSKGRVKPLLLTHSKKADKNKHGGNNVPGRTCQLDTGKAESFGIAPCFVGKNPDTSCMENALKFLAWILLGPASNQFLKENKGSWGPGCSRLFVLQNEGIFIFYFLTGFKGTKDLEKLA